MNPIQQPSAIDSSQVEIVGMPRIKVLGLGGGGSNAVNRMIELGVDGVAYLAANTDRQALESSLADIRLQWGPKVTRGLGAGGDPRAGSAAAMESSRELTANLRGADLVFITAGMGGGTGTGSAPVAAEIAREVGAVVVAIVTLPFGFEMNRRAQNALAGVRKLQPHAHTLVTVPNDRLLKIVPEDLSLEVAFRLADDVLRQGVQGVAELVTRPGLINVDFAHVRQLLLKGGGAHMAIGMGRGDQKAVDAVEQALRHPLLEIDNLSHVDGVLVHFTGGDDMSLHEIGEAVEALRQQIPDYADLVLGASTDRDMNGRAQAILLVTGVGGQPVSAAAQTSEREQTAAPEPARADVQSADLDLPTFLRRRVVEQ